MNILTQYWSSQLQICAPSDAYIKGFRPEIFNLIELETTSFSNTTLLQRVPFLTMGGKPITGKPTHTGLALKNPIHMQRLCTGNRTEVHRGERQEQKPLSQTNKL